MKKEVHPILIVVILVVVAGGLFLGYSYLSGPRTPAGVKYEPGVPPWMSKDASGKLIPKQGAAVGGAPTKQ